MDHWLSPTTQIAVAVSVWLGSLMFAAVTQDPTGWAVGGLGVLAMAWKLLRDARIEEQSREDYARQLKHEMKRADRAEQRADRLQRQLDGLRDWHTQEESSP